MASRKAKAALVLVASLAAGAVYWSLTRDPRTLQGMDRWTFASISRSIARSPNLELYEGLPHQAFEEELLRKELALKKTVQMSGFPFYAAPLPVSTNDANALRELCTTADSFQPYGGPKMCGGFHPDYSLVWKDGKARNELLICFGCWEMLLVGEDQKLLVDIREPTMIRFKDLLKRYRKQRPSSEPPG